MSSIKSFRYDEHTTIYVEEKPSGYFSYYERVKDDGIFCSHMNGPHRTIGTAKEASCTLIQAVSIIKPLEHDEKATTFVEEAPDGFYAYCKTVENNGIFHGLPVGPYDTAEEAQKRIDSSKGNKNETKIQAQL